MNNTATHTGTPATISPVTRACAGYYVGTIYTDTDSVGYSVELDTDRPASEQWISFVDGNQSDWGFATKREALQSLQGETWVRLPRWGFCITA